MPPVDIKIEFEDLELRMSDERRKNQKKLATRHFMSAIK